MNRVRVVFEIAGNCYRGPEVGRILKKYLPIGTAPPPELKGWKRLKWMSEAIPQSSTKHRFWAIREPRRVNYRRSRYVTFNRAMMIGKDLRKKKKKPAGTLAINPFSYGSAPWRRFEENRINAATNTGVQHRRSANDRGGEARPARSNWADGNILYGQNPGGVAGGIAGTSNPAELQQAVPDVQWNVRYTNATGGTTTATITGRTPNAPVEAPAPADDGELSFNEALGRLRERLRWPIAPTIQPGVVGSVREREHVADTEPHPARVEELDEVFRDARDEEFAAFDAVIGGR